MDNSESVLVKHLRYMGRQYESGNKARGGSGGENIQTTAAYTIEAQSKDIAELVEALEDFLRALPVGRDWLNPDIERLAYDLIAKHKESGK